MSRQCHSDETQCPSPGTIVALLDRELGEREAAAARCHLRACPRCRQLADELSVVSQEAQAQLNCLDDERIAAYVDWRARRMRTAQSKAEIRRTRKHLRRCERCREQAELLARACSTRVGVLGSIRALLGTPGGAWKPIGGARARLAVVAVVAAGATVYVCLAAANRLPWGRPTTGSTQVASAPTRPSLEPQTSIAPAAPQENPAIVPGARRSSAVRSRGRGEGGVRKGTDSSDGRVSPQVEPQAAMVPANEEASTARALTDLQRAARTGSAGAEARAAFALASIHHKNGNHRSAASFYGRAAAAAERAADPRLQIDSLILLGAALAELGETGKARERFESALELARDIAYAKGEQNALVQLQILETNSDDAGG